MSELLWEYLCEYYESGASLANFLETFGDDDFVRETAIQYYAHRRYLSGVTEDEWLRKLSFTDRIWMGVGVYQQLGAPVAGFIEDYSPRGVYIGAYYGVTEEHVRAYYKAAQALQAERQNQ